jgi:hypothetical protein
MRIVASAGHDEYRFPETPGVTDRVLFDGVALECGDDEAATERARGLGFLDEMYEIVEDALTPEAWAGFTGEPAGTKPEDADLTWEVIHLFEGEPEALLAGLDALIESLYLEPHGDDDAYDYWPSGVRLAMEVDAALGGPRAERIREVALFGANGRAEILAKVGIAP